MTQVSIIVPVVEEHDATPYGQYVRHVTLPRVPLAGEWMSVGAKASTVQNVLWHVGEVFERVEVYLSQRPLGPGFPETINELYDGGFMPMRFDGSEVSWEEDAEMRTAPTPTQQADPDSDQTLQDA